MNRYFYFAVTVEMGYCDGKFTSDQRHRLTGKRVKGQNRIFRIFAVFQKIKLLLKEKFHTLLLQNGAFEMMDDAV